MIPQLDRHGLIPPGVWDCTLQEIEQRFVFNDHRATLWAGFIDFLRAEGGSIPAGATMLVDGSFCRNKPMPSDIDVVVDLTPIPADVSLQLMMELRFRHDELKNRYHVDLWSQHPLLPHNFIDYFQYIGDKAAIELQLHPKMPKGILKVV